MKRYSADDVQELVTILSKSSSIASAVETAQKEVKAARNLTRTGLGDLFRRRGLKAPSEYLTGVPLNPVEEHQAKKAKKKAEAARKELLEKVIDIEKRQAVLDELEKPHKPPKLKPRERTSKHREGVAVALASDWHVEETVYAEQVGGRNEYTLEIAEARAIRFFEGFRWLMNHHRQSYKIRDAVLWLGGDLMTGYIHEELEETNGLSPFETVIWLRERIASGITFLLQDEELKKLVVVCSHGNHGRVHKRKRIKTGARNSFEWLLYTWLKDHFKDDKRVEFVVDQSAHQYVEAYDFTLHFHHGDDVKYNGGVGGLFIPLNKRIPAWDRIVPADYHHIGHFHQYTNLGRAVVNGSLIGYSEYAMSIGAQFEEPQQAFYLLDKTRGKTFMSPIWVDE